MKLVIIILVIVLSIGNTSAKKLPGLKISKDKCYIVTENNQPFFWLGGTAWEMLHRLSREEIKLYLKDRAAKGFTVIQTVILAELDGVNTPNYYDNLPLKGKDVTQINEAYFKHVDFTIKEARKLGMYVGLLPTWGDKFNLKFGIGPEIFTTGNAEIYGEILAKRYKNESNIIWILGGDRIPERKQEFEIIRAMAKGIRKVDHKHKHLMTYHPSGTNRATEVLNDEWLDMDMYQSGHLRDTKEYEYIGESKRTVPQRPVICGEPRYENIIDRFWEKKQHEWMDDSDVRVTAYWALLAGAAGYTYGCNDIWQFYSYTQKPIIQARTDWSEAIHLPGSRHMMFMKNLFVSFPWQELINNQSLILNENPEDDSHILCSIGKNRNFLIAYTPLGKSIKLDLSRMRGSEVVAYWYNPRSGKSVKIGEFRACKKHEFEPWATGRGSDFVLVIWNKKSNFKLD